MSLLSYPENLPLPLQADYSINISPNIRRSSMSDGWIRQRKVTSNALNTVSVSFYFDEAEINTFMDFWASISEGADWFLLKLPTKTKNELDEFSTQLIERKVRFQNGKYTNKLSYFSDGRWLWKITANLDIQNEDDFESSENADDWNTDSEYNFEFLFQGDLPVVKGKKRCFLVSGEMPTGSDENPPNITLNSSSLNIGINFYSEGLKLNTTDKKILEIQTEYIGFDSNTYSSYYYFGRMMNSDKNLLGFGLWSLRNNYTEFSLRNNFAILNNRLSAQTKTDTSYHIYDVSIPQNTKIIKRDIFINDPSSGTCHYYCVLNDELTADIIYNSCFNFDAVLYQIGDPTQNGYYNFIKIYSIKAKNSLFKGIPEHAA